RCARKSLTGPANDLRAHLELGAGEMHVRGDVHADTAAAIPVADGEIDVRELDLGRAVRGVGAGGIARLEAHGSVRGRDFVRARGEARIEIRGASYGNWSLGDLDTTTTIADERASVEGNLRSGSGKASWKAAANL